MTRTDPVGDVVADELVRVVRTDDGVTVSAAKVESAPVAEESAAKVRVNDGDVPVSAAKDEPALSVAVSLALAEVAPAAVALG